MGTSTEWTESTRCSDDWEYYVVAPYGSGNDLWTKEQCFDWCSDPEIGYYQDVELGVDMCCQWDDFSIELNEN